MKKCQILVIEENKSKRNLITSILKNNDYSYICAETGEEAIVKVASFNPDVLFLDLELSDIDGLEVIKRIREWSNIPIMIISSQIEEQNKIKALDAGADDFLSNPFSADEMLARLRVMQRRLLLQQSNYDQSVGSIYVNGDLKIDYSAGCAYIAGEELKLTPIEYKLLCLLARNTGKVLTHKYITQMVWGNAWDSNVASLRVFMVSLRKKLDCNGNNITYIQTHIGIGYRMLKIE